MWEIAFKHNHHFLLWHWSNTETICPEKLLSFSPWRCSKPGWMQSWPICYGRLQKISNILKYCLFVYPNIICHERTKNSGVGFWVFCQVICFSSTIVESNQCSNWPKALCPGVLKKKKKIKQKTKVCGNALDSSCLWTQAKKCYFFFKE